MPWDPDRYHKFQKERFAPFEDLIRRTLFAAKRKAQDGDRP